MPVPRVLVLTTTYPRFMGDSEPAFVHYLNRQLVSRGAKVHALAPHCKGAKTCENLDGVNVHRFRYLPEALENLAYDGGIMPKLKQSPWLIWQMPFLFLAMFFHAVYFVRKYQITHIHAHWVVPQGLIAATIKLFYRNIKILVTSHGTDLHSLNGKFMEKIKACILKKTDCFTVVSQAMFEFCKEKGLVGLAKYTTVLPMGVDTAHTFYDKKQIGRNGFVFVGRLVQEKGVEELLQAFKGFLKDYPDEALTIIGSSSESQAFINFSNELGISENIMFLGSLGSKSVSEKMNRAKFLILPSHQEGLGLVIVEALACGLIPLVSDLPAINDVHNEPFLKFTAGDVGSLLACMLRCYQQQDKAKALAEIQKQAVISKFSWETVGENYYRLLQ